MQSTNPVLTSSAFKTFDRTGTAMTIEGTIWKTTALLAVLLVAAGYAWWRAMAGVQAEAGGGAAAPDITYGLMTIGALGGFVLAMVTVFVPRWSPFTSPVYAICEGLFLGSISAVFNFQYPGIAIQAVSLTFATMGSMLLLYRIGALRATRGFKMGMFAAMGGIMLVYLADIVLGLFFKTSIPMIHGTGLVGIGFSLFVVVIAALNFVLDFDMIERNAEAGAPKYMEWYAAFGLLVTLVWLYLELLRLLSKFRSRD